MARPPGAHRQSDSRRHHTDISSTHALRYDMYLRETQWGERGEERGHRPFCSTWNIDASKTSGSVGGGKELRQPNSLLLDLPFISSWVIARCRPRRALVVQRAEDRLLKAHKIWWGLCPCMGPNRDCAGRRSHQRICRVNQPCTSCEHFVSASGAPGGAWADPRLREPRVSVRKWVW